MLRDISDGHRTIRTWLAARRLRRRFRRAPQFALAALPEDTFGRVTGVAEAFGDTLVSPLSNRACVYWILEVVEDVGEDWPSSRILAQHEAVPFAIHHEGHRAVIVPEDATVSLAFDRAADLRGIDRANAEQKALLRRYLRYHDFTHTHALRIREAVIELGETVTILGAGTREPDPDAAFTGARIGDAVLDGAYRDALRTRLRLTSSKQHPLCITDDPKVL